MKYIRKRQEPPEFKNWKEQANSDWQPDFRNLAGKPKEILIKALMTEQGEICCYCENRLIDGKCGSSRLCVIIFAYGIVKCLLGKTFRTILRIFYQYRPRFHTETRRASKGLGNT
jgi:hypothetical protein